jgi:hypothetical protein
MHLLSLHPALQQFQIGSCHTSSRKNRSAMACPLALFLELGNPAPTKGQQCSSQCDCWQQLQGYKILEEERTASETCRSGFLLEENSWSAVLLEEGGCLVPRRNELKSYTVICSRFFPRSLQIFGRHLQSIERLSIHPPPSVNSCTTKCSKLLGDCRRTRGLLGLGTGHTWGTEPTSPSLNCKQINTHQST